jgi:hypothetical protein
MMVPFRIRFVREKVSKFHLEHADMFVRPIDSE